MPRALFLALPMLFFAAGCSYDNGDARRILDAPPPVCGQSVPAQSAIDVGSQIEVDAGQGAGVFVEYTAGGHWHVRTACDTLKTSASCQWDIIVTPEQGRSISNVAASDLEPDDEVRPFPDDPLSYQLLALTSGDIDGFTFDTEPGSAVRFDSLLDGDCALPYFFWVGDGALHPGAPSNPVDLTPGLE